MAYLTAANLFCRTSESHCILETSRYKSRTRGQRRSGNIRNCSELSSEVRFSESLGCTCQLPHDLHPDLRPLLQRKDGGCQSLSAPCPSLATTFNAARRRCWCCCSRPWCEPWGQKAERLKPRRRITFAYASCNICPFLSAAFCFGDLTKRLCRWPGRMNLIAPLADMRNLSL